MRERRIGYYWPERGETADDARYFKKVEGWNDNKWEKMFLAEEACEHCWKSGGWEWLRSGEVIALVVEGKDVGTFDVSVDYRPDFYCRSINERDDD